MQKVAAGMVDPVMQAGDFLFLLFLVAAETGDMTYGTQWLAFYNKSNSQSLELVAAPLSDANTRAVTTQTLQFLARAWSNCLMVALSESA